MIGKDDTYFMISYLKVKKLHGFKINYNSIMLTLMLLFLFEPAYFSQIKYIHFSFTVGKIAAFAYGIIKIIQTRKVPKVLKYILLYLLIQFITTLYNLGNIKNAFYEIICGLGVVCVIFYGAFYNKNNWLSSVVFVFELLIYGNFISVLIAPNGLYIQKMSSGWWTNLCWFLGIRNGMTLTYVLAAFFELAYFFIRYKSSKKVMLRTSMFFLIATITILKISSSVVYQDKSTSAGGLSLIWGLIIIYVLFLVRINRLFGWFSFTKGVVSNYILMFILVVFQLQYYFSWIIVDILKKDITMTGRTTIWKRAVEVIREHWIFGYGLPVGTSMSDRLQDVAAVTTTQNGFLDVAYVGGICLSIVLVLIFLCVSKHIKKYNLLPKYSFFIGYFIALFLLATQGESIGGMRLFTMLIGIWCVTPMFKEV